MAFRRKKSLKSMVRFYWRKIFCCDRSILSVKNDKFFTDESMLSVASMNDSIVSIYRRLEENRGIFFNKKLHRIRGLKGMCKNKMKRNHTHDFFSSCSDTFPLILVFCAAFYWRIYLCFFILTVHCNRSFDTVPLNHRIWLGLLLKNIYWVLLHSDKRWQGNRFFTDGSIPLVESEPMDRWSSVWQGFCDRWSILSRINL